MVKKIALEEHFLSPGLVDYWRPTMSELPPERAEYFFRNLTDFGELRLKSMDEAGIARSVLSIAGP
ncbi:MAG: amidohydrolase, partial [Xanthobacteraceae bacterium]